MPTLIIVLKAASTQRTPVNLYCKLKNRDKYEFLFLRMVVIFPELLFYSALKIDSNRGKE